MGWHSPHDTRSRSSLHTRGDTHLPHHTRRVRTRAPRDGTRIHSARDSIDHHTVDQQRDRENNDNHDGHLGKRFDRNFLDADDAAEDHSDVEAPASHVAPIAPLDDHIDQLHDFDDGRNINADLMAALLRGPR